jgi:endonuclease YncB( thermonuclease family)
MKVRAALALFVSMTLGASICFADTRFQGQAVRVLDGDTIEVLSSGNRSVRVRLANIDAPEKTQPFGQKSKEHLIDLVAGKDVVVIDVGGDQYGRRIGRVLVDGQEANVEQVRSGLAWVYTRYNHDGQLPSLEGAARSQRVGLWVDPNPQAPWEYRHQK